MSDSPFTPFLTERGYVVLDGGLATALEAAGHVLDSDLWSAALLRDRPEAIASVHRAFLDAGADCITTASYQASFPGFADAGIDDDQAVALLRRSSEIALAAREAWVGARRERVGPGGRSGARATRPDGTTASPGTGSGADGPRPLVAASVGPWGAFLADGSEYDGRYGISRDELDRFHRRRFGLLASTGVDLLACETIPSGDEAEVLLGILDDHSDNTWAWLSFACRDGAHLHDGTPIEDVVGRCGEHERVAAVGVNCTPPRHVPELVERAAGALQRADALPLIAYPNSGEAYDASSGSWSGGSRAALPDHEAWLRGVLEARRAGARILGGCCRVGPRAIAELRERLVS